MRAGFHLLVLLPPHAPPAWLATARRGAFNMHGSLLPKYPRPRAGQLGGAQRRERDRRDAARDGGEARRRAHRRPGAVPILPDDTAVRGVPQGHRARPRRRAGRCLPRARRQAHVLQAQDLSHGSYFGGRTPEDGRIDWSKSAREIHNLVRAVAPPYPGAFTDELQASLQDAASNGSPACTRAPGAAAPTAKDGEWYAALRRRRRACALLEVEASQMEPQVLILGVNGFIGHHLSKRILDDHRLGGLRHGHADRPHRGRCSTSRASTSSKATSPSTGSGSSTTSASATWCCRWSRSRRRRPT